MLKYVIKRTLLLIPTLLVVLTIVFVLLRLVPGGPESRRFIRGRSGSRVTVLSCVWNLLTAATMRLSSTLPWRLSPSSE